VPGHRIGDLAAVSDLADDLLPRRPALAGLRGAGAGLWGPVVAVDADDRPGWRVQLVLRLASRAVIDQALGVIMAQQGCTAAGAFDILRSASQNRNVKVREIAELVIAGITG
jgi:ANTAR domain